MMQEKNTQVEEKKFNLNDELDCRFPDGVKFLLDENNKPYNVQLVKIDISYGNYSLNTYYKMQIGRDEVRNLYILFTNWGRIGNEGQHQLTPFFLQEECLKEFKKIFKQKTGNVYEQRQDFVQKNKKYFLLKSSHNYSDSRILTLIQNKE